MKREALDLDSVAPHPGFPGYGISPGLTKRELFAALALQGLLACPDPEQGDIVSMAVRLADRLIVALSSGAGRNA